MSLDDPAVVAAEHTSERGLEGPPVRSTYENAVRRYPDSTVLLRGEIDRVPELEGPLRVGGRTTIFVTTKAE